MKVSGLTISLSKEKKAMKKCLLFVLVLGIVLCGCGKKEPEAGKVELSLPEIGLLETKLPDITKAPVPKNQNLLTGNIDLTKEAIGKRPVAVMINNVKDALPQYGISQADVIFELPVEGNLTRLMALYADYTQMPDICAIRSCRYYYPAIAKGFDAFYVHWGIDQTVKSYVASLNMDCYEGLANAGGLFARDQARQRAGYALEHTGYFKGTQFASVVTSAGKRTDLLTEKQGTAFKFCGLGTTLTPTGASCNTVNVGFGSATAGFTYNSDTKTYYKTINGQKHMDVRTNEQLSFTNVFVLETSISIRDDVGHKKLDWAGSGSTTGYYISNGGMQKIRWSKAGGAEEGYLQFYDESGNELEINRGKSYIAYTYKGKTTMN